MKKQDKAERPFECVFFKGFLNLKETASRDEAVNWDDRPLKGMRV